MKEVTRIINLQITAIEKVDDDLQELLSEEESEQRLISDIKGVLIVDDALVLSTKTFIRDDV